MQSLIRSHKKKTDFPYKNAKLLNLNVTETLNLHKTLKPNKIRSRLPVTAYVCDFIRCNSHGRCKSKNKDPSIEI